MNKLDLIARLQMIFQHMPTSSSKALCHGSYGNNYEHVMFQELDKCNELMTDLINDIRKNPTEDIEGVEN